MEVLAMRVGSHEAVMDVRWYAEVLIDVPSLAELDF